MGPARCAQHTGSPDPTLALFFLADKGQHGGAAVRRGAVLEQEDALPGAELQPSVGDGYAELGLGQRALDLGRHVVRPFVIVGASDARSLGAWPKRG